MTGAGKKRDKATRHVAPDPLTSAETSISKNPTGSNNNNDGGFDDPKTPQHGFGPGLGYDPARMGAPASQAVVKYGRLELPPEAFTLDIPTDLPVRHTFNSVGKEIKVRVNQYKVLTWPDKKVYQYDVTIGNGDEKRGLIRAVWKSKALRDRLKKIDCLWLFDGNKIAWCSSKASEEEIRMGVNLDAERGREPRFVKGVPVNNTISVRIRLSTEINMAVINAFLTRKVGWNNHILQAINFLDHLIRQWPSEQFVLIKRSFFGRGSTGRQALDNVIEGLKGVYSSIRLCPYIPPSPSIPRCTGLALNVDVANGTFWISQPVHQTVRNFLKAGNPHLQWPKLHEQLRPVLDPKTNVWQMSKDFKELRKLTKLRFTVVHRGKQNEAKVYTIKKFAFDPEWGQLGGNARNITFKCRDPVDPEAPAKLMSVYKYFDKKYGMLLEQWQLPLIQTEKDGWFPMEVCVLESNQRYQYKLNPDQTSKMIKFAVSRPGKRMEDIKMGMGLLKHKEDPYLQHYNIQIDSNMTITPARHLKNPEVLFSNGKTNPGNNGRWDLRDKKFIRPNTVELDSWAVGIVKGCLDEDTVRNFIRVLIQQYQGHGGKIKNKNPPIYRSTHIETIADCVTMTRERALRQSNGQEPQILLYVLPDKNSFEYERGKKSNEIRYGAFSQMMLAAHVQKAQPQYCSNVCMKLNAKLGGTTSLLSAPSTKTTKDYFNKTPTMIIGVDVSHASPGSIQPSMAALTMSMDREAARYCASVQTNGNRVEMLTTMNIRTMIIPAFNHWMRTVGGNRGPTNVYYFRDGVSEGQYVHVLNQEVAEIRKIMKELYPPGNPKFTVTICSKRHHLRFFPLERDFTAGDKNGNPLPGTIVERDITHPFENDFYLSSHVAIQGTARPVHYHVILDEIKVQPNTFHAMIYEHCYQYMRSTTPVSIHPAVYYAHLASNRARAHEGVPASEGPRSGKQFVETQQDKSVAASMAGRPQPVLKSNETEAMPLMKMGGPLTGAALGRLMSGMWYI